ncbi:MULTISPECIES: 1-deoxy-D-xylulose-5-phosphate reductoisomerase [Acidiphilium]|jgi:1-deoxy-D-xylulose-5-phosphate reductoisomerase|uniref:1-deoxy-D-xylulose 5-phosphate reductoisomerase n=4 Tax=Acidiphilium TaxID=522 RepID=A5G1L6_ACICJ|nr:MULTISPECIES: 1-deoxy-D-xylulose-5-phosphate reductoisomerase [Acidiphilium]ABQ31748.1 1-deoxy-D-xylulose 5-phosphate reductoisomerase [Acidiphilium cryptum JF-5]KDM67213.1 1-deoxy-D-xylulose 5-phosphate reductoisomerase Dxr [Acidiphilium sp. JA12-A1]MBU6357005.1 1-deoxy-D-xylulose-5-phosphate reductoisomerase [Rhodospirillales bacterium]BAJ82229.1 1-deoxy-D-xylulose 5-phosphate reductoisomerase [Acidiphilium multivorum AIU301]
MAVKTVTILGSTGSVGTQTIDLLQADPENYRVRALIAGRNAALLAEQARSLHAEIAVIADESAFPALRDALAGSGIRAEAGRAAVIAAAAEPADWTMAAITGTAGLEPTLAATRNGGAIALANKEALVSAGDVFLAAIAAGGATLLPVDSEHNAIFQSLADGNRAALEKIILTASGGPFREASLDEMKDATPETALKHPVWSMGAKISIDSATLFNKGLEVIEAARIFGLAPHEIEVLVHPQSIVHGMVCYRDGSVLAQMGAPDMRIPIAHTLAWPARLATSSPRLDLAAAARLDFLAPDPVRFPALRLAREALEAGHGASTVLNAANEIAVEAFLRRRIGFLDITAVVERVMQRLGAPPIGDLAAVLALDAEARAMAEAELRAKSDPRAA